MTGWNDEDKAPPPPLATWKRRAARSVLWLEALTAAFWPAAAWAAFYAGLVLAGAPGFLGAKLAALLAAFFYIAFFLLLWRGARGLEAPQEGEELRRIERDNAFPHRPLSSLGDRATGGSAALWALAQEKNRKLAARAAPILPGPVLPRRDVFALRFLAALALCVGLVVAGGQGPSRLAEGFFPFSFPGAAGAGKPDDSLSIQIVPPAYTGAQTVLFKGGGSVKEPIRLPQGSVFKIRASGGWGTPEARMGGYRFRLGEIGEKSWAAELMAIPGEEFALRQMFMTRLSIPYEYVPDAPPIVTLTEAPEILPGGRMRFKVPVRDDYGVRDLEFSMEAAEPGGAMPLVGAPVRIVRAVMTAGGDKETALDPVYDLTAHPWAGLPVLVSFTATDALGQNARSETLRITLPERSFRHPVAAALVALRKKLAWTPDESREEVMESLLSILERPGAYGGDPRVFLGLRVAASRLYYNPKKREEILSLVPLLWDIALRIEDGNLSLAARTLRDAREALEQALRDPSTTEEELAVLNDRLRAAMIDYLRELGREMQKRAAQGQTPPAIPPEMLGKILDGRELGGVLDRLQSESLAGNRDKAMEMLSMLEKMTDLMDPSLTAPMPPDVQFMSERIGELQELVQRQEALLEQTKDQARQMEDGLGFSYGAPTEPSPGGGPEMGEMPPAPTPGESPGPSVDTSLNRGEQEALRLVLGELMREAGEKIGEVPQSLGKAEMEMRDSAQELGKNRPDLSAPHQEEALRHLKEGAQDLAQKMGRRLQQMTGLGLSFGGTDPLGRPYDDPNAPPGMFQDRSVELPSEAERRRIDEILETLRKRSGEYERPQEEIEYLRRLLRQF